MKRIALRTLIGSVALSALLGIYAILVRDFGDFEVRILLTSLVVIGVSILVMACGVAWEKRVLPPVPQSGAAVAIACGFFTVLGIWVDPNALEYWKFSGSLAIAASALAHSSLIALARLGPQFAWSRVASFVLAVLLAVTLIVVIWGELDDDGVFELIAVLAILFAAMSVAVPVFHRMSRMNEESAPAPILFCPMCGASLQRVDSPTQCDECHARFRVEQMLAD